MALLLVSAKREKFCLPGGRLTSYFNSVNGSDSQPLLYLPGFLCHLGDNTGDVLTLSLLLRKTSIAKSFCQKQILGNVGPIQWSKKAATICKTSTQYRSSRKGWFLPTTNAGPLVWAQVFKEAEPPLWTMALVIYFINRNLTQPKGGNQSEGVKAREATWQHTAPRSHYSTRSY